MKLIREFKCDLTGDDCVIIENHFGDEICYTKSEYLELKSYVEHEERQLWLEQN